MRRMGGSARHGGGLLSISPHPAAAPPTGSTSNEQSRDPTEAGRGDQARDEETKNGDNALENGSSPTREGNPAARDTEADEGDGKPSESREAGPQLSQLDSPTDRVGHGHSGGTNARLEKPDESLDDKSVEPTGSNVEVANGGESAGSETAADTSQTTAPVAVTAAGLEESARDGAVALCGGVQGNASAGACGDKTPAVASGALPNGSSKAVKDAQGGEVVAPRIGNSGDIEATSAEHRANGGDVAAATPPVRVTAPARGSEVIVPAIAIAEDSDRGGAVGDQSEGKFNRRQDSAEGPGGPHGNEKAPRVEKHGCGCVVA